MRSKKLLILYAFLLIVAVVTMVQLWRLNQRPQEIGPRDYPEIKEEITANVEVLQVFKITKVGTIAGCMVREGKIKRSNKVRVIRDGIVVHAGELESLKRFKDDVKEVVAGLDCGLNLVNYNDIQVGDIIEAYEETEIKKTL